MASYKRKLKDRSGNYVLPATRSPAVYMNNNQDLETYLNNMRSSLQNSINSVSEKVDSISESSITMLDMYPVGAIYESKSDTSPASLMGGSWWKVENRFLLGTGTRAAGATGGEENHTLALSEIPWHTHMYEGYHYVDSGFSPAPYTSFRAGTSGESGFILLYSEGWNTFGDITDGSQVISMGWPHNNMPPYYAVNIWERTA